MSDSTSGAFNSGISTLMRIDEILKNIYMLKKIKLSKVEIYDLKFSFVEDLLNMSAPLIGKKSYNEISKKINTINYKSQTKWNLYKSGIYKNKPINYVDKYVIRDDEIKLNRIIVEIQFALQDAGNYLMPKKTDAGNSILNL